MSHQSVEIPGMWRTDGRGLRVLAVKPTSKWRAREIERQRRLREWAQRPRSEVVA